MAGASACLSIPSGTTGKSASPSGLASASEPAAETPHCWADEAMQPVRCSDTQRERLGNCLRRLRLHARPESIALAGSAAIELHLMIRGLPRLRSSLTDVD